MHPEFMRTNPEARLRLVAATAEMLAQRGLNATSVREVAKAASAPLGSTYHYFPGGKQQMVVEALQYAGDKFGESLATALQQGPVIGLRAFFALWQKILLRSDYRAGCPVLAVSIEEPSDGEGQAALSTAASIFGQWEALLCASLEQAGAASDEAQRIATLTVSAFEGAAAMCRARRSVEPLAAVNLQLEEMISTSLAKRDTSVNVRNPS